MSATSRIAPTNERPVEMSTTTDPLSCLTGTHGPIHLRPSAYRRACAALARESAIERHYGPRDHGRRAMRRRAARHATAARMALWEGHAAQRAEQRLELLTITHREQRAATALNLAKMSAAQHRAERELQDIRHADELERARQYPMRQHEFCTRVETIIGAVTWLTIEERQGAASDVWLRLVKRHGWPVPADQVTTDYVRRRATGYALRKRELAARHDYLHADEADEPNADEQIIALRKRVHGNVYAIGSRPLDPSDELSAAELADRMGVEEAARPALLYALGGYATGHAYAVAAGITDANAKQRLKRGRDAMRRRYADASELADAVRRAQRIGGQDGAETERRKITPAERELAGYIAGAEYLATETRQRAYRTLGRNGTRGYVDMAGRLPVGPEQANRETVKQRQERARRSARTTWSDRRCAQLEWSAARRRKVRAVAQRVAMMTG